MPTITVGRPSGVARKNIPAGNLFRKMNKDGSLMAKVYMSTGARTNPPSGASDTTVAVNGRTVHRSQTETFGRDRQGKSITGWGSFVVGEVSRGNLVAASGDADGSSFTKKGDARCVDLGAPSISIDSLTG